MDHTYYVAKHKKVYGTHKDNKDVIALLYATYMKYEQNFVGPQNGASLANGTNKYITINNRLRISVSSDIDTVKIVEFGLIT